MANGDADPRNWTVDVQRGLAWTIVITFALLLIMMAVRVIWSGTPADTLELLKQAENALINIVMVVIGYFFGSSNSSKTKDEAQNRIVEKLTGPPPPPAVVVAWWSLLTAAEKAAITAAGVDDGKVAAFIAAAAAGRATPEDLAHLVTLGLITPERSAAILAA